MSGKFGGSIMGSYREQVLFSAWNGARYGLSLSEHPSAYDYVRISYGTPNLASTANTMANLGPMMTVTYPTSQSYMLNYSMFFGGVSTTTCNTPYRAAHALSACNTQNWLAGFNTYGGVAGYSMTNNAAWTRVYSVVGIKSGEQGNFHKDLLYDRFRDNTTAVTLRNHPSAYRRIGVVVGANPDAFQGSVNYYQEYPTAFLKSGCASGNIMTYCKFSDAPPPASNVFGIGMYGNCFTTAWTRRYGMYWTEDNAYHGADGPQPYIRQVIGIDRI